MNSCSSKTFHISCNLYIDLDCFHNYTFLFFFNFCRQKALKELTERLNKERPRVVGNIVPQKSKIQSPQKKVDIIASSNSAFVATEKEPLLPLEQNIESNVIDA